MLRYGFSNSMSDLLLEFSRGSKVKNTINENDKVYPFFEKCLQYVDKNDSERVIFFENALRGKFSKQFKYNKSTNTLSYRNKKIKENLKLSLNPEEATKTLINFFHTVARNFSKQDLENIKKRNRNKNVKNIETWSDIKCQRIKDILIENFAVRMCKERKLDFKHFQNIESALHSGFMLNKINSADVIMSNGEIHQIKNLQRHGDQFSIKEKINKKGTNRKNIIKKYNIMSDKFYSDSKSFLDLENSRFSLSKKLKANIRSFLKSNA
jgi:hypothetical protein